MRANSNNSESALCVPGLHCAFHEAKSCLTVPINSESMNILSNPCRRLLKWRLKIPLQIYCCGSVELNEGRRNSTGLLQLFNPGKAWCWFLLNFPAAGGILLCQVSRPASSASSLGPDRKSCLLPCWLSTVAYRHFRSRREFVMLLTVQAIQIKVFPGQENWKQVSHLDWGLCVCLLFWLLLPCPHVGCVCVDIDIIDPLAVHKTIPIHQAWCAWLCQYMQQTL